MFLYNKIYLLEYVKYSINYIKIPAIFKNDKEILLQAIKYNLTETYFTPFIFSSGKFKNDINNVLNNNNNNNDLILKFASKKLRNDKEIVLEAVKKNGLMLKFASNELRNDKEIILAAIKNHAYAFEYASEELRDNKEFLLYIIKNNILHYAFEELRINKEIILNKIKNNNNNLNNIIEIKELDNYNAIILENNIRNITFLEYASDKLKNDREIILEVVKRTGWALKFASNELRFIKKIKFF
jgi:hypothetical protein